MNRTRVKICGVCRPEDALAAANAGADAIGMVLHPASPRNISFDQARQIIATLPPFVTPVGLFVDQEPEFIIDAARQLGLRCVQLHGRETPETIARLTPLVVLKAVRIERATLAAQLAEWRRAIALHRLDHLRGLVLETAGTTAPGGTGVANDWTTIREALAEGLFRELPPLIAAGGLTPGNVGGVVRSLRPWAVDVSSGVGEERRTKSQEKIDQFILHVQEADHDQL